MQTVDGVETFSGTQLTIRDWFTNPFKRVEWLKFADGNEIRIGDITSFIVGGSGNDVLIGTNGNDFVYGGAGDDELFLLLGDDIGNGGTGNDLVRGDGGRDLLIGGLGDDELTPSLVMMALTKSMAVPTAMWFRAAAATAISSSAAPAMIPSSMLAAMAMMSSSMNMLIIGR
jgi:RTX calcium-binding nonapeptide repeat (4 copies)